jgi:predicted nucleic acid-binding protein
MAAPEHIRKSILSIDFLIAVWYTENMLKVYLETTVFNRFYDKDREFIAETKELFQKIKNGRIEAYTSTYVIEELDKAPEPKRKNMLNLISEYGINVLEIDQRAIDLADIYIEMGIIPLKFRMDGVHIAMASISEADCIISLNFHHINKLKTKMATEIINRLNGYSNPYICTPMEVFDYE